MKNLAGQVQSDALGQLHDIHLPEPLSWWPPAPGWWLLLLLLLICLLLVAGGFLWRRFKMRDRSPSKKAMINSSLRELDQVESALQSGDEAALLSLSTLLRRVALQLDAEAAALTGDDWLQWLDSRWDRDDFSTGEGCALVDAPYRQSSARDGIALSGLCREWLETQR
ncbi:MAG: DUF4381 domain-containing protein [Mariprofundus sp.]